MPIGMGQWWAPAILLMSLQNVRYMWEVELFSSRLEDVGTCKNAVSPTGGMAVPHLPGTMNSGAHNTVPGEHGKAMPPVGKTSFLQVPTSSSLEEINSTSHMYLTFCSDINSIAGAHHYPIPIGVGNKA